MNGKCLKTNTSITEQSKKDWKETPTQKMTQTIGPKGETKKGEMKRVGDNNIRILGHLAMRLKERRKQKKKQEGAKRNETIGVWKIKLGVWEW